MKLSLKYFVCPALMLLSFASGAQVQFEISVNAREIGKRDELQVEYVISGSDRVSNFKLPYFKKWTVMSGPSTSTEVYTVNGTRTSTHKYIYLLSPTGAGKLELPATSVDADGKTIHCKGIFISVKAQDHVDGAGTSPAVQSYSDLTEAEDDPVEEDFKEYILKPGEDAVKKIKANLFIRAIPSKTKCYVGEPVLVTYKLYTRLRSNSRVVKQPTFTGCSVSEMTTNDVRSATEVVNGKKYTTHLFRKVQLFPLQAGRIMVTQASVDNTVTFISNSTDVRKLYYGIETGQEYDLTLSTEPFFIEVLPLPGKEKAAAVGSFEIFTRLKKDTIAANEPNALIVTIVGRGNFKSVREPEIQWPGNLYPFDATETDEVDRLSFPLTGRKIYEIPFEANATGNVDLAPVSFSYFDPSKGAYRTVQSRPLHLTVTPAIKANLQQSLVRDEVGGFDIRYLFYLLPAIFFMGAILILVKTKKKPVPVAAPREITEPNAPAPFRLEGKIDELVLIQDDTEFYNRAGDLARSLIQAEQGNHELLVEVLQDCNTILYTPIAQTGKKEVLQKLQQAIA